MPIGETTLTVVGNLTADPELSYTESGVARATFNVASNSRVWDKTAATWGEGHTLFMRCTAWRWLAENAAHSLSKGVRVIVTGALRQFDYTAADGSTRTGYGIDVDDIAVSLRYATATIQAATRTNSESNDTTQTNTRQTNSGKRAKKTRVPAAVPPDDPWAIPDGSDEPPF